MGDGGGGSSDNGQGGEDGGRRGGGDEGEGGHERGDHGGCEYEHKHILKRTGRGCNPHAVRAPVHKMRDVLSRARAV